jgi:hypothetical protein
VTEWLAGVALAALAFGLLVFRATLALSRRAGRARASLDEQARRLAEAERLLDALAEAPPDDPALLDSWRHRMRDRDP